MAVKNYCSIVVYKARAGLPHSQRSSDTVGHSNVFESLYSSIVLPRARLTSPGTLWPWSFPKGTDCV